MQCISPIWVRKSREFVPCGKCNFCLDRRRREWSFRLRVEQRHSAASHFLTLTYADEKVPVSESGLLTLEKSDLQKFFKKLRKANAKYSRLPVRYYSIGEYGSQTSRPHYHSILFNVSAPVMERVHEVWENGFVCVGDVTPASVNYVTSYVINRVGDYNGRAKPFSLITNRSGGLGKQYLETHSKWHTSGMRGYVQEGKVKGYLPRYYRDRLFNVHEKEFLRMQTAGLIDEQYEKDIADAMAFHHDPSGYYLERQAAAHEALGRRFVKSKQLQTV